MWPSVSGFFHLACFQDSSMLLHVLALLFMAKKYSIAWIYYISFIRSSIDGFWSCFHLLVIMNNVAMNICMQVFGWTYVFSFLEYIPKRGIAGSYGNFFFFNHGVLNSQNNFF